MMIESALNGVGVKIEDLMRKRVWGFGVVEYGVSWVERGEVLNGDLV